ncbi:hypothetical protein MSIBF_A1510006 [groundwater metagenome]|uniref:Uncharacterized protein n=1 Tax=groundwater metagenome TaxID=717931 RepID=A0A098E984_9ZZZZ
MCPELNSDSVLMFIAIKFSLSEFSSINLCASYASMFFIVVFVVVVVCNGVSGVFVAVDVFHDYRLLTELNITTMNH